MTVAFWMDEAHRATALAAGAIPQMDVIRDCGLSVGDTISFPGFRALAFRVVSRHYRTNPEPGQPTWLVQLEPAEHPF